MAIYQVNSYNNDSVLNKIPLKNGYIYHMTHIEHLPSILAHGLLSHNNPYKKHDISNKNANDKRERIEPIHNRSVHEYVPFYFNSRNAMLFVVQKEYGENIVLLEIKKEILLSNGVIFTNGNAAAQSLGFADDIDDLLNPNFINWNEVFATSWNDANENIKNEKKFKMMAEVLVPDMVPSAMIAGIVCQNPSVCEKVARILNNSINISWNSSLFFNVSSNNESFEFSANAYYNNYEPNNALSNQKREFKYYPQTKEELKALVDNENIYLGDIDTSAITDMSDLFCKDYDENKKIPTNDRDIFEGIEFWDVSNVTNMDSMFFKCENFNEPLDSWNVSNVENMNSMFYGCHNFNQPLNSWNTRSATNMGWMFAHCLEFNQPLDDWYVSKVIKMNHMFCDCSQFNQDLRAWDVSNVVDMTEMFLHCKNFDQSLKSWNICNLKYINDMFKNTKTSFKNAININKYYKYHPKTKDELKALVYDESIYLGYIDTSAITDMSKLFYQSERENFDGIELWDVSNVTDMSSMFSYCVNFNQSLNSWNVSNVTDMHNMFWGCKNFNQPLSLWNINEMADISWMFGECESFKQSLLYWKVDRKKTFCHKSKYLLL